MLLRRSAHPVVSDLPAFRNVVILAAEFDRLVPVGIESLPKTEQFDSFYRLLLELGRCAGVVPAVAVENSPGPNPFRDDSVGFEQLPGSEHTRYQLAIAMAAMCRTKWCAVNTVPRGIVITQAAITPDDDLSSEVIGLMKRCVGGGGFVATLRDLAGIVCRACLNLECNSTDILIAASEAELCELIHTAVQET